MVVEAAELLAESRVWSAVGRVARELLRYQEIGYQELQFAVLDAAGDDKGGWPIPASPGRRVLTKAQAWERIAEKSLRGAANVRAWQQAEADGKPSVERR